MIGNQLHTLSYLKRVTGTRSQEYKCDHVLALAPADARNLDLALKRNVCNRALQAKYPTSTYYSHHDMRSFRPSDGWGISRTDQAWLDVPDDYVVVFRASV